MSLRVTKSNIIIGVGPYFKEIDNNKMRRMIQIHIKITLHLLTPISSKESFNNHFVFIVFKMENQKAKKTSKFGLVLYFTFFF